MAQSLQQRMYTMLTSHTLTDVTFIVQGEEIKGHKAVIASYGGLLKEYVEKNNQIIDIGDIISPETFKTILQYIYTDEATVTDSNVFELLLAAAECSLNHLEQMCVDHLGRILSHESLGELTKQALLFNSEQLLDTCIQYFGNNTERIIESNDFPTYSEEVLSTLCGSDQIDCLEVTLFSSCVKWAENRCKNLNLQSSPENLRKIFGNTLQKMRFSTMKMEDFLGSVVKTNILTTTEVGQVIIDSQASKDGVQSPMYRTVIKGEASDMACQATTANHYNYSKRIYCDLQQATGILSYQGSQGTEIALLVTQRSIKPGNSNFIEIEIVDRGQGCCLGVGLVPPGYGHELVYIDGMLPGWGNNSVGYHADDGGIFLQSGIAALVISTCTVGDRMGVGVKFLSDGSTEYYFKRNGTEVHKGYLNCLENGSHHFAIGMETYGEKVRLLDSDMWLPEN